jgi:hypothetical protein
MKRLIAASLLAAVAATAAPASAGPAVPQPGGTCESPVDVFCRRPCREDELDCGLIPPCVVWVGVGCVL